MNLKGTSQAWTVLMLRNSRLIVFRPCSPLTVVMIGHELGLILNKFATPWAKGTELYAREVPYATVIGLDRYSESV